MSHGICCLRVCDLRSQQDDHHCIVHAFLGILRGEFGFKVEYMTILIVHLQF